MTPHPTDRPHHRTTEPRRVHAFDSVIAAGEGVALSSRPTDRACGRTAGPRRAHVRDGVAVIGGRGL